MSAFDKSSAPSNGSSFLLRGLILCTAAAALVIALTGIAAAAIVIRRPSPPLPVMLTGPRVVGSVWITPPAPRIVVMPAPRPGWTWSPGHWRWSGTAYVWVDGVWLVERPGFRFVPAHWNRFPDGWRFIPGGWVRRPL